jgi:hypothetical protein
MDKLLEGLLDYATQAGVTNEQIKELTASLTGLADTADTVREVFKNTWAAIEMGSRLQGLSMETGESVAKLYEFERGLDAVGKKGKYLPAIFSEMHRALSRADDNERVGSAFRILGLNPNQLRKEDTADAVLEAAQAMGKTNLDDAAWAGRQIFGDFHTETIFAIARNLDSFQREMNESSAAGGWLEKYSQAFEGIKLPQTVDELLANAVITARDKLNAGDHIPEAKNTGSGPDHYKPEFTSLEKMGFIMSGSKVQNPYDQRKIDLLQQIAENTKKASLFSSVTMPDDKHLRDIVDPSPFISNIV